MQMIKYRWTILLLPLLIFSCADKDSVVNSAEYKKEEINVYVQLLDELMDSVGFEVTDTARLVFYLRDTLAGEDGWQVEGDLLKADLERRPFTIKEVTDKSLHKFLIATDTLRLDSSDHFTRHWIRLSRVRFNKDFTVGFLRVGVWCGDLCSWTDSFDIKKTNGRWQIIGILKGPRA